MNTSELIADIIENIIGRMTDAFSLYEFQVTEYSIYYDANKHPSWFIELYFSTQEKLTAAIDDGTCYEIHKFLSKEFRNTTDLEGVASIILFECGTKPSNESEYHKRYSELVARQESLKNRNTTICENCGHDFDKHLLKGHINPETNSPTEGWMTCPEENCNCFRTWSADYNKTDI